jgi:GNAT superfamily N-acetyltransferase
MISEPMSTQDTLQQALLATVQVWVSSYPGASYEIRDGYSVFVVPTIPVPDFCGVYAIDAARDADTAAALPDLISWVESHDVSAGVIVRGAATPKTELAADALGLTNRAPSAAMTCNRVDPLAAPGDFTVEEVHGGAALDAVQGIFGEAFGAQEVATRVYAPGLLADARVTIYLARDGGEPVSTLILIRTPGAVGVFNVATAPDKQRRGYASALISASLADDEGLIFLLSSPEGRAVYERLGFSYVEDYHFLSRPAPAE